MYSKDQLCFSCLNSDGKCSWSKNFTPIEGWNAEPKVVRGGIETFRIYSCPKYIFDGLCSRCVFFNKKYEKPEEWFKICPMAKKITGYGECSGYINKDLGVIEEEKDYE